MNGNKPINRIYKGTNLVFKKSILPVEYVQLEYIESTGLEYIELDYIANQDTNANGTYQILDTSTACMLFGGREKSSSAKFYGLNWGGGVPYKYYNSYYSGQLTSLLVDTEKHTFNKKAGLLKIDNVNISEITVPQTTWSTVYNIVLFGCKTAGEIGFLSKARIYNLQFLNGEEVIYDFVPCYRKSDGETGLYDLINDTFYTNDGNGEFIRGGVV